jgi:hypothetical protein
MIAFKFQNATIEAPDSWDEVTVAHFIKPEFLARDAVGLLSALTGIDRSTLLNATDDITEPLNKIVEFYAKDPQGYKSHETENFKFRGKKIKIPKDIELEKLGQKILFGSAMGKHKFVYEAIPEAVAIYIIPLITSDGSFDDSIIEEVAEEIKLLKIKDVYPVADFFLSSFRALAQSGAAF